MQYFKYFSPMLCGLVLTFALLSSSPAAALEGSSEQAPAAQTTVTLLTGVAYVDALIAAVEGSQESVSVLMFACVLPENPRSNHPVQRILDSLIQAKERGVTVRVIFDNEVRSDGSRDTLNDPAVAYLHRHGVAIHRDEPDLRSHSKLIIIDDIMVISGSTNWTWSAFYRNREHAFLVHDRELAAACAVTFTAAWELSVPAGE